MKLDLKINYSKLDTLHTHTVHYIQVIGDAADAIHKVQRELRKHDSKAIERVILMGERIIKRYEEVLSALEDIKKSIYNYREDMYDIIKSKAYSADVRVDYLDLGANVTTIVARSLQFYDIPTDIEGNALSVVFGDPSKLEVAAGMVVMAFLDEVTNQKNAYFQTLLDIKTNKMPACAGKIDTEAKRLNKILKAAKDFQEKDIYYGGKASLLYTKYTNTTAFYEDLRRYKTKKFKAQLEGAWDNVVSFFAGLGDIATTYFPAIPASLEFIIKKHPSDWAIDTVDKANAKTDTLKEYLKDPFGLVENISQQATDTLDKKGAAYAVAYVVTDLVGMEVVFNELAKAAKAVGKSDEIAEAASKVDDVGRKGEKVVSSSENISGTGMCFTKGTLVASEEGHKPIDSIMVGDRVLAYNIDSKEQGYKRVEQLFISKTDTLVIITIDGQQIETTKKHPFYIVGKGWVSAQYLTEEDQIFKFDGSSSRIESIKIVKLQFMIEVFNIEVDEWHTYFVTNQNVLVHNDCSIGAGKWHKGSFSSPEESLIKHFKKHGAEVGATNVEQYLRKAESFANNLRGATKKPISGATSGVIRYYKNGKYIDIVDGKIISFGKQ